MAGRESLKSKFFTVKRRATQVALERLGKTSKRADNSEVADLRAAVEETDDILTELHTRLSQHVEAIRSLTDSGALVGVAFHRLMTGAGAVDDGLRDCVEKYRDNTAAVDGMVRADIEETVVGDVPAEGEAPGAGVLNDVMAQLTRVQQLRQRFAARDRLKIDFDAYSRQVDSLRAAKKPNPKKIRDKERKLNSTKATLENETANIIWESQSMLDRRPTMLLEAFRVLSASQSNFYRDSASRMGSVGEVPFVEAPKPRDRPAVSMDAPSGAGAGHDASAAFAATLSADGGDSSAEVPPPAAAPAPSAPLSTPGLPTVPKCRALYDYAPTSEDELALTEGALVDIIAKQDDGWWEGRVNGQQGVFPSNYVEEL